MDVYTGTPQWMLKINENYLCPLMEKISHKKHAFLLGDINIDLIKNDSDPHTSTFLDSMTDKDYTALENADR